MPLVFSLFPLSLILMQKSTQSLMERYQCSALQLDSHILYIHGKQKSCWIGDSVSNISVEGNKLNQQCIIYSLYLHSPESQPSKTLFSSMYHPWIFSCILQAGTCQGKICCASSDRLSEARLLQLRAPGPTSSEAEHVFPVGTCTQGTHAHNCTCLSIQINRDRKTHRALT